MTEYSQELQANFEGVEVNGNEITVSLLIRGISKKFTTDDSGYEIRNLNLGIGERIRFLYRTKTEWTLKRLHVDSQVEKPFRKD